MTDPYKIPLPPIIMTKEEVERLEEEALERERERERLYQHKQEQKQRKSRKTRSKPEARMLRTPQAAQYLGISGWTLRQMVYNGEIECIRAKYWTFDIQSLDKWITTRKEKERL